MVVADNISDVRAVIKQFVLVVVHPHGMLVAGIAVGTCSDHAVFVAAGKPMIETVFAVSDGSVVFPTNATTPGCVPSAVVVKLVAVATPRDGVVAARFVTVVPLGRARTPVALAAIAALPLDDPLNVTEPPSAMVKPPA